MSVLRSGDSHRSALRARFLIEIPETAHGVLEDLLPLADGWRWDRIEDVPEEELAKVEAWAARWNIRADWVVEHAIRVLSSRRAHPSVDIADAWVLAAGWTSWVPRRATLTVEWCPWLAAGIGRLPDEHEKESLAPGLDPHVRGRSLPTEDHFSVVVGGASFDKAEKLLRKALKDYMADVRDRALDSGFELDGIRETETSSLDDRIGWLIQHTVLGQSWAQIAQKAFDTQTRRDTIHKASKRLAELLGLPL